MLASMDVNDKCKEHRNAAGIQSNFDNDNLPLKSVPARYNKLKFLLHLVTAKT